MAHKQPIVCTLWNCHNPAHMNVVSDYEKHRKAPFCYVHIDEAIQQWNQFEQEAKERDRR